MSASTFKYVWKFLPWFICYNKENSLAVQSLLLVLLLTNLTKKSLLSIRIHKEQHFKETPCEAPEHLRSVRYICNLKIRFHIFWTKHGLVVSHLQGRFSEYVFRRAKRFSIGNFAKNNETANATHIHTYIHRYSHKPIYDVLIRNLGPILAK